MSCTSSAACTAVGSHLVPGPGNPPGGTLAERWNGSGWSVQATPDSSSAGASLTAVSCPSASDCMAVGSENGPLTEEWTGSAWTVEPVPGASDAVLSGVSCTAADACMAVGSEHTSGGTQTLAARWDGTAWSLQATPNPSGAVNSVLLGVSCPSPDSCQAVGDAEASDGHDSTLVETWDGSGWTITPSPNSSSAASSILQGVSCSTSDSCSAVGYTIGSIGAPDQTLAERWDGASWTIVRTPNPGGPECDNNLSVTILCPLHAVSCPTDTTCEAVGSYRSPSAYDLPAAAGTAPSSSSARIRGSTARAAGDVPPSRGSPRARHPGATIAVHAALTDLRRGGRIGAARG